MLVQQSGAPAEASHKVQVSAVLAHYVDHKYKPAQRAAELIMQALVSIDTITASPMVSDLTLTNQQRIWSYMANEELSSKSISTYCISLRAAVNFAAKPQIVDALDESGNPTKREIRLLSEAVPISTNETDIARFLNVSVNGRNEYLPTYKDLAYWIDRIEDEAQFRYVVIALNTWARNEAIFDLRVTAQVDFETGLLNLNPPGRTQTKKYRPTIRLTQNLRHWLLHWGSDKPIFRSRKYVDKPLNALGKHINQPEMTCYTIRHFMASHARRTSVVVSKEQRSQWLGHVSTEGSRTTDRYEKFDPDFLEDAMMATDEIIHELNSHIKTRSLIPPKGQLTVVDNVIMAGPTFMRGADNPRGAAKLDWDKVAEVKKMFAQGVTNTKIASRFGVSEAAIRNIKSGRSWQKS